MHIFLTAFVVILLIIFIFETNKKGFYKLKRSLEFAFSLPGPSIFSSFVNLLQIAGNYKELINYVEATTKKYGNFTRLILGTDIYVVIAKPEDYKLVLMNQNGNNKSTVTKTWETLLGDGIIRVSAHNECFLFNDTNRHNTSFYFSWHSMSNKDRMVFVSTTVIERKASSSTHKLRRKIIQPFLNLKYLSEYVTHFDIHSNFCADTLEKNVDGPIFDLKPYIARYSFDIFLATIVGVQESTHKRGYAKLLYWQEKLFKDAYNRVIKPWLNLEWILPLTESRKQLCIARKNVLDFIYNISLRKTANHTALQNNEIFQNLKPIFNNYWNRVEELRNNTSKSCEVSDENFLDDIRNFFAAVQNTITEVTSFIILTLAIHTEVQEKLREEISVTFNHDKVDAQRLLSMRYFHMVYQETLRLFPISPIILRQLTGDIKLESCTLPEGCYVMIPIFAIHRNPAYWHKPLEFIPERFSSSHHRYTYIPFGTGLRDCLGQRYAFLSVATIIVNLMRRYRFVNTNSSIDDIKVTTDIVLRVRDARVSISSITISDSR